MRGEDEKQQDMFSYISPEQRVPADHPLRAVREMVDQILKEMSPRFARLYSDVGRPSIAPERLLRTLLLQIFYTIRSERLLVEQLNYNLLFRWFVGMNMDDEVWNHAVFSSLLNYPRRSGCSLSLCVFKLMDRAAPLFGTHASRFVRSFSYGRLCLQLL